MICTYCKHYSDGNETNCKGCGASSWAAESHFQGHYNVAIGWKESEAAFKLPLAMHTAATREFERRVKKPESWWQRWFGGSTESTGPR